MSQPVEDIIMKAVMELFKGDAVKFFGINKQIVSATTIAAAARTELTHIHIQKNIDDWILEADDNSFIHFEFQSDYDPKDLYRFMVSDAMLCYSVQKPIRTIVVYTADIKDTITVLDAGAIQYKIDAFYMSSLDGDTTYEAIRSKIATGKPLTKQDLMSIVFLPMMMSIEDRVTRFERSISLSKEVSAADEQLQIQAMLHLLADKFVKDPGMMQKLKEMINMSDLTKMIREDAMNEKAIGIARNLLKRGISIEAVKEDTGLDEPTINKLQDEVRVAV